MGYKDILVTLASYPEPTSISVLDSAVSFAAALGAHLAALSCETHVQIPGHFLSGSVVNIPGIIAGETAKSRKNGQELLAAFDRAAEKADISHETVFEKCATIDFEKLLVDYARLRDLTIVSVPASYDELYAESVIFGSGKPTLVLPETRPSRPFELGTVALAWDFSRTAARAVADALPILERATKVRIITIVNDKVMDTKHSAEELAKNLCRHGIEVALDKVDAHGRPTGEVLESYALSYPIDLLVMGAYGHSRLREFILGGATQRLLSKPPLPILFSH
jgi:nucleotide-binding universal stress UspA family protein